MLEKLGNDSSTRELDSVLTSVARCFGWDPQQGHLAGLE